MALKIKEGQCERIPEVYTSELWNLIQCMLRLDQAERFSVDEIVRHPLIEPHLDPAFKTKLEQEVPRLLKKGGAATLSVKEALKLQAVQEKLRKKEA